jgi:hypothetical protein
MKITKKTILILLAASLIFGVGCSAGGTINHTLRSTVPLETFKTLQVNVDSKVADSEKDKTTMLILLTQKLKESGKWDVKESGQLRVDVVITDMRRVSQTARVLLGAFAGKAKTTAEVTVSKLPSGEKVSSFTVEGESSGGSVFAGGTDESVLMAATKIVEAMNQK